MRALEEHQSLLIFQVGPVVCSVDVLDVDAIIMPPSLSRMPGQADFVEGVFRHREQTYSMVNLYRKFGLSDTGQFDTSGRVIVAHTHHGPMGFMVDTVLEVTSTSEDHDWGEAPNFNSQQVFIKTLHWQELMVLHTDFDRLYAMADAAPLRGWLEKQSGNVAQEPVEVEIDHTITSQVSNAEEMPPAEQFAVKQEVSDLPATDKSEADAQVRVSEANQDTGQSDISANIEPIENERVIEPDTVQTEAGGLETVEGQTNSDVTMQSSSAHQAVSAFDANAALKTEFEKSPDFVTNTKLDTELQTASEPASVEQDNKTSNVIPFATAIDKQVSLHETSAPAKQALLSETDVQMSSGTSNLVSGANIKTESQTDELAEAVHQVVDETLAKNPDWRLRLGWLGGAITALALVLTIVFSFMGDGNDEQLDAQLAGTHVHESVVETTEPSVLVEDTIFEKATPDESNAPDIQTETEVSQPASVVEEFTRKIKQEAPDLMSAMKHEPITDTNETASDESDEVVQEQQTETAQRSTEADLVESTPVEIKAGEHLIVKGDTLWELAGSYLHNPLQYPKLAKWSGIKNPDLIYPGGKVTVKKPSKD